MVDRYMYETTDMPSSPAGFYFPDAEYLSDPEGLLKYLVRRFVRFVLLWL